MTAGEYLRSVRESYDMGVMDLCRASGLSTGTICAYEGGTLTNPKIATVVQLAEAYRVDPLELAGRLIEPLVPASKEKQA